MRPEARLLDLNITLPDPPPPGGAYSPTAIAGGLLYIAAQFPLGADVRVRGRLGDDLTTDQGRAAARLAALNVLAHCRAAAGSLDRVSRILRVEGHMLTTPDFTDHARVLDGASELFNDLFGADPGHVRALYGHASLPAGLSIELVAIAQLA